jgi:endonuclease/exonuclease/phosphatase family metal-dependent hydrolase
VRTWNLYHGRTKPPSGRTYLERMLRLVSESADLVALQEVPVWALTRLHGWSGMAAFGAIARPPRLGAVGRRLTALAPDLFRSAFNGQANALLVRAPLRAVGEQRVIELRRRGVVERRVCQLMRLQAERSEILVANFHATAHVEALAREDVERVAEAIAGEEPAIVCGDFNVRGLGLRGFSPPLPGIDQVLVRGLEVTRGPQAWRRERRTLDGVVLSDHAPVEAEVG